MRVAFPSMVGLLLAGAAMAATAPETGDALRDAPPPRIEITPDRPLAAEAPHRSGNPLWSIPLRTLTATRELPIFSPSRRPPAPAIANMPFVAPVATAPPAAPPERLTLSLIGTISSDTESFAILIDSGTSQVVRLRAGEAQGEWILTSVRGREVTLQKGQRTETLRLPKAGEAQAPPVQPGGTLPEPQL
jgi:general secretion pathway protein N